MKLKKPISSILLTALSLFLLISCTEVPGKLLIMEANNLASQGRYTEAIDSYYRALDYESAAPYAQFGLGAVFFSLDEGNAALERYNDSRKLLESLPIQENRELLFRNFFNVGVVLFARDDFSGAAKAFRSALQIDSGRIEAKRNLELSLLSLDRQKPGEGEGADPEELERRAVLFEYLRQKEQTRWKSQAWTEEEEQNTGQDY